MAYNHHFDLDMMQLALDLAKKGRYSTSPNPRVGCVITQGTQIVGQGFHIQAGTPHAEIHALRQAGNLAKGGTAYVTLEPCSHTGKTGPCADALIQAGIKRVVAAMQDPNPLVAGQGFHKLRTAGIAVESGLCTPEARELNRGFLSRIERNRPFISVKIAASLDGKIALSDGTSQWITGEKARTDVQTLRAASCAILTGIGTIVSDNPQLNVRAFPTLRQPTRIILDSQLRTPTNSQVINDSGSPTLIVTTQDPVNYPTRPHLSILTVPANPNGQIDICQLMPILAQKGFGEILVESGTRLSSHLIQQKYVDEIILYQAGKLLGNPGYPAFELPENPEVLLHEAEWKTQKVEMMDNDIKWVLRHSDNIS